jgi:hypothetical protein
VGSKRAPCWRTLAVEPLRGAARPSRIEEDDDRPRREAAPARRGPSRRRLAAAARRTSQKPESRGACVEPNSKCTGSAPSCRRRAAPRTNRRRDGVFRAQLTCRQCQPARRYRPGLRIYPNWVAASEGSRDRRKVSCRRRREEAQRLGDRPPPRSLGNQCRAAIVDPRAVGATSKSRPRARSRGRRCRRTRNHGSAEAVAGAPPSAQLPRRTAARRLAQPSPSQSAPSADRLAVRAADREDLKRLAQEPSADSIRSVLKSCRRWWGGDVRGPAPPWAGRLVPPRGRSCCASCDAWPFEGWSRRRI